MARRLSTGVFGKVTLPELPHNRANMDGPGHSNWLIQNIVAQGPHPDGASGSGSSSSSMHALSSILATGVNTFVSLQAEMQGTDSGEWGIRKNFISAGSVVKVVRCVCVRALACVCTCFFLFQPHWMLSLVVRCVSANLFILFVPVIALPAGTFVF